MFVSYIEYKIEEMVKRVLFDVPLMRADYFSASSEEVFRCYC